MASITDGDVPLLLQMYDFGGLGGRRLVDLGGNWGKMLLAVKERFPEVGCSVVDLPGVVASVPPAHASRGVDFVAGDMFDASTLPACDAVLLPEAPP